MHATLRYLLAFFLTTSIFTHSYSQQQASNFAEDTIRMHIRLGPVYFYQGKQIFRKELTNLIRARDSTAYDLMIQSNKIQQQVLFTGITGGATFGFFLGKAISQTKQGYSFEDILTKTEWIFFTVGTGLVVTSFILSAKRNKLTREAINRYNRHGSRTSSLRFQWLGTGARLVYSF